MKKFFFLLLGVAAITTSISVGTEVRRAMRLSKEFQAEFSTRVPWILTPSEKDRLQDVAGKKIFSLWRDRVAYVYERNQCLPSDRECVRDKNDHIISTEDELNRATALAKTLDLDPWPMCKDGSYPTTAGCEDGSLIK